MLTFTTTIYMFMKLAQTYTDVYKKENIVTMIMIVVGGVAGVVYNDDDNSWHNLYDHTGDHF